MDYYHDLITEKSWKMLQDLKRKYKFILIGGWAVYLYTHSLKSRDIDFICDYKTLEKLKLNYELVKNNRLKKYEIHAGEFDIDIYIPFFSELGIPVEDLLKTARQIEGFLVVEPEALLILKQKAWRDRAQSMKGEKDKIDIAALLMAEIDYKKYHSLLKKYKLSNYAFELKSLLSHTRSIPELGLYEHSFSKLKKKILKKLEV